MWHLKKVFITGATSGLGMEVAMQLLHKGCELLLTGRNKKQLLTLQSLHQNKIHTYQADLANRHERAKLIKKAIEFQPDLVINNAGFGMYGSFIHQPSKELMNLIETNCIALMEICMELAKKMNENSMIVNVSSIAGSMPTPGMSIYGASKAFVTSFSQALQVELKEKKIDVLTFAPGGIQTNFSKRAAKNSTKFKLSRWQNSFSMTPYFAAKKLLSQIEKNRKFYHPRFLDKLSTWLGPLSLFQKKMNKMLKD